MNAYRRFWNPQPARRAVAAHSRLRRGGLFTTFVAIAAAMTACSSAGAVYVTTTAPPHSVQAVQSAQSGGSQVDSSVATGGGTTTDGGADTSIGPGMGPSTDTSSPSSPMTTATQTTAVPQTTTSKPPQPVHVATFEGDDQTYGIGMAVMVLFTVAPTDAAAFDRAATVTVNGQPATGSWLWQKPTVPGYEMEALYREKDYWPAHSTIAVDMPIEGLSAGDGLVYDDSLSVDFAIGAAHISHVNNSHHRMTVTSDGDVVKNFPVSLGSATTPTYDGVKVVMAKSNPVEMKSDSGDPHPYDIMVPWSVRITNSGEFVHAASWNTGNIGSRNTSHGCTNLGVSDAKWFYNFSQLGDVVDYPDADPDGAVQPSWDGWGWWNLSWSQWTHDSLLTS